MEFLDNLIFIQFNCEDHWEGFVWLICPNEHSANIDYSFNFWGVLLGWKKMSNKLGDNISLGDSEYNNC